jgi:hypothetical protein
MASKYDEAVFHAGNFIRGLLRRTPTGVPLDVADDVMAAARRGTTTSPDALFDSTGRSLPEGVPGWPAGTESFAKPYATPSRFDGIEVGPLDSAPDFELGSPLWHQMDKGYRAADNLRRGRTPNLRNQDPQLARIAGQEINARNSAATASRAADAQRAQGVREGLGELGAAAATVGIGAGLSSMYPSGETPAQGDMTDTSGAEDLAAESSPPPATLEAPADYSFQARELMGKLNAMRRAAGGEVPEAQQMMAEIDRLLGMSNQQKNAPGYKPPMPTDYHGEAQRLLQDLNARRMEAGGEVADTQKVMAEVRRLQAMGDQMRNAR